MTRSPSDPRSGLHTTLAACLTTLAHSLPRHLALTSRLPLLSGLWPSKRTVYCQDGL